MQGPHSQIFCFSVFCGRAPEFRFVTCYQMTLLLLIWGPHLTTTALVIQYLTNRLGKSKVLREKREGKYIIWEEPMREKHRLPQSGWWKAHPYPPHHGILHQPILILLNSAGGHFLQHFERKSYVHWLWIYWLIK